MKNIEEDLKTIIESLKNIESNMKLLNFFESLKKCGNCKHYRDRFCWNEKNYQHPDRKVKHHTARCEFWESKEK